MTGHKHVSQEEVARYEAEQLGHQVKKFGDLSVETECFYLYEDYRHPNFCTARFERVYPQCEIRGRTEFNARCCNGWHYPQFATYNVNTFVLVN